MRPPGSASQRGNAREDPLDQAHDALGVGVEREQEAERDERRHARHGAAELHQLHQPALGLRARASGRTKR